jgi:hypothetical protein
MNDLGMAYLSICHTSERKCPFLMMARAQSNTFMDDECRTTNCMWYDAERGCCGVLPERRDDAKV